MEPHLLAIRLFLASIALLAIVTGLRGLPSIAEGRDNAQVSISVGKTQEGNIFLADGLVLAATDTAVPPTDTAVPPTNTAVPPTNTAVPKPQPTDTAVPPTNTVVPPTNTSVPPTNTSVPPTNTAIPPTSTAIPPTNTAIPSTSTAIPKPQPTNTPTLTPTPTKTPTLTPPRVWKIELPMVTKNLGPRDLLSNGDFETGTLSSWSTGGGIPVSITSSAVNSGRFAALLGNPSYSCSDGVPIDYGAMQQGVFMEPGATIRLSFSYRMLTQDTAVSNLDLKTPADTLDVVIVDQSGVTHPLTGAGIGGPTRVIDCGRWWDSGWNTLSYNVSDFAGQTVLLKFALSNRIDGYYNTYVYIDDIQMMWTPW